MMRYAQHFDRLYAPVNNSASFAWLQELCCKFETATRSKAKPAPATAGTGTEKVTKSSLKQATKIECAVPELGDLVATRTDGFFRASEQTVMVPLELSYRSSRGANIPFETGPIDNS